MIIEMSEHIRTIDVSANTHLRVMCLGRFSSTWFPLNKFISELKILHASMAIFATTSIRLKVALLQIQFPF